MNITPDSIVYWRTGFFELNATLAFTWGIMLLLAFSSFMITRTLSTGTDITRWQNALEVIVEQTDKQIKEVGLERSRDYLPFIGTLFLFIAVSNLLAIIPGYKPPTGSLSTTAALAVCVFFAVPAYSIYERGMLAYLKTYVRPNPFMLPFNIIGDLSRTLALAVRLFGNIMSGTVIVAILISIAPLFFPVLLQALGLLTGMVQAYIFAILAAVYISAAAAPHEHEKEKGNERNHPEQSEGYKDSSPLVQNDKNKGG